ncbi:MAG: hypothetical protein M1820_004544 [Bogoriella megaspora]|nr:MAG: hypothetical protein M1820_004544 [Bogoriella megaspora]
MPAFASQFALSLELTRVIGAAASVVPAAVDRLFNDARELKKSGSDIVVEEDLAVIFRQMRIDPAFENKFKTGIAGDAGRSPTVLATLLPITLFSSGPTVRRALQYPAYLPMVIQLSLLCASHNLQSLSEGLEEALRLRSGKSGSSTFATYDSQTLHGVLRACSEQTSSFSWFSLFEEVDKRLGLPTRFTEPLRPYTGPFDDPESQQKGQYYTLTVPMLQACLDMLAATQRFEDEHYVVVDSARGVSTIVVWTYHVLGLTVQVNGCPQGSCVFGKGRISVIVNLPGTTVPQPSPAMYLMDVSDEVKLKIGSEDDHMLTDIVAERKIPALGYVKKIFELDRLDLSPGAIHELVLFTAGMAVLAAPKCHDVRKNEPFTSRGHAHPGYIIRRSLVEEQRNLNKALDLLTGSGFCNRSEIETYVKGLEIQLEEEIRPLASLDYLKDNIHSSEWYRLVDMSRSLAEVIVAFAAVGNLESCQDLMLRDASALSMTHIFRDTFRWWDRKNRICIKSHDVWFSTIEDLLPGKPGYSTHEYGRCLSSGYGWSVFLDTLWDKDPITVRPGRIWIQKGVPYRDGSYARAMVDGPNTFETNCPEFKVRERFNDEFRPRCEIDVDPARYMVALRDDCFFVSRRLRIGGRSKFCCIGYNEMAACRFTGHLVPSCDHVGEDLAKLDRGMVTLEGFIKTISEVPFERLNFLLTSGNPDARWLGLLGLSEYAAEWRHDSKPWRIMIKGPQTCMSCCIQYATAMSDYTFLIL